MQKETNMKLARASGTLVLAALAIMSSQFVLAQGAGGAAGAGAGPATSSRYSGGAGTGWYGGVSVGRSNANIDNAHITSNLLGSGFATTSISNDDSDTAYKLFAGYKFNRNFALEGGYFDLGRFGFAATTVPAGTLSGNIKLRGLNLDAVGILPINEKFSAFGRVGLNYAEAKDSFSGTGAVNVLNPSPSKRDTNIKFGAGLQYDFNPAFGMRAEAERYRIDDAVGSKGDVDVLSVGLVYRFSAR